MIGRGVEIIQMRNMSRIEIMSKKKNGHSRLFRKKTRDQEVIEGDMIKDDYFNFIN